MAELYLLLAGVFSIVTLTYMWKGGVTLATAGGWVVLTCIHGLLVKPLFVYFDIPNAALLDGLLFRTTTRDEYWQWGIVSLLAYGLFFGSMVLAGRYNHLATKVHNEMATDVVHYGGWRLLLFLLIGAAGIIGFLAQFPTLLETMSKNRIATTDLADYNAGGLSRFLANFAYIVSVCALVNARIVQYRRSSFALFAAAVVVWLPFCYLSDQRGLILFSVVAYLIAYNRCVKKLSLARVSFVVGAVISLVLAKTISRFQAGGNELQETVAQSLGNLVGQNLIELSKMISIIKAIPEQLDFQYGFSYLNSILILIPRSLFPDKPFVNLDTTIGQVVFGCNAFGACAVPPGLLAESYLNWGVSGLFVAPILIGVLVGKLDLKFRVARPGGTFEIFYIVMGIYLGMAFLGSGLSSSITDLFGEGILIWLVCFACRISRDAKLAPFDCYQSGVRSASIHGSAA
jgi:oligosaccharide repeat unit polymerase